MGQLNVINGINLNAIKIMNIFCVKTSALRPGFLAWVLIIAPFQITYPSRIRGFLCLYILWWLCDRLILVTTSAFKQTRLCASGVIKCQSTHVKVMNKWNKVKTTYQGSSFLWVKLSCLCMFVYKLCLCMFVYMSRVMEVQLYCYLVLLLTDSKTR